MDEQKLQDILGQTVEVPDMIDKKLKETYAGLEGKRRPAKRGLRPVRTALIAAALAAALCVTAMAAYQIFRQDVEVNKPQLVQGILGGGEVAWDSEERSYDARGSLIYCPKRELVPVDVERAMELLGDYLPPSGYQWQLGDCTFTVEGYVLDEHTGTGRVYYTLERPGGFPEGAVHWDKGTLNKEKLGLDMSDFEIRSATDWPWFGSRQYVDVDRSTQERLVIVQGLATAQEDWRAEDGLRFGLLGEILEMPGVKSLPAMDIADPETGETVVTLSAIGVEVRYPTSETAHGYIGYLALEYADGTSYVIREGGTDNADYAIGDEHLTRLRLCFNRLVDPNQVAAVIVDGTRYEVN